MSTNLPPSSEIAESDRHRELVDLLIELTWNEWLEHARCDDEPEHVHDKKRRPARRA